MDRNRNWPAWIALVLAGLALVVALGGRGHSWSDSVAVPGVPAAPAGPEMRFGHGAPVPPEVAADIQREMGRVERGFHGPTFGHHGQRFERGWGGPMGFFPAIFGALRALGQLIGLGLLAWLLLKLFRDRRAATSSEPAPPTTPAGHDPRVE